ncbi:MAG: hypothetical protein CMG60_01760 [Candidatus Marinimicrobia bacterium]|nr:hypothetical protein [Candidatus Neomarinimicrobiota bacterium]|tara:strand:- start:9102 stop:9833 length:732 start_codon:yes stop_codon:yes gene_type:complete
MRFLPYTFLLFKIIFAQTIEHPQNSPLSVLSNIIKMEEKFDTEIIEFDTKWVDSLSLSLPCEGIPVPKRTMRLPNAPREYRNGIHRGVDFFANWGTPVKAVADGIIIRSDLNYEEVPASFRENLLRSSAKLGDTPSDIFNNILLGKAIFIDHGFELVRGFRTITIYAHLSHIEKNLKPGEKVYEGEIIGKSGNTGMRESTLGSKAGSHLHWEMIFQKGNQEIYLGKGIPNPELYEMLSLIFKK